MSQAKVRAGRRRPSRRSRRLARGLVSTLVTDSEVAQILLAEENTGEGNTAR